MNAYAWLVLVVFFGAVTYLIWSRLAMSAQADADAEWICLFLRQEGEPMDDYRLTVETDPRLAYSLLAAEYAALKTRIEQAEAAALTLAAPCRWQDDGGGEWHSGCGRAAATATVLDADSASAFCPGCGHPLAWGGADGAGLFTDAEQGAVLDAAARLA